MGGLFSSKPARKTAEVRTYQQPTPVTRSHQLYPSSRPSINSYRSYPSYPSPQSSFNSYEYVPRHIPSVVPTPSKQTSNFLEVTKISKNTNLLPMITRNHNNSEITCIIMNAYDNEYSHIQSLFRQTGKPCMRLKSIQRIQNPYLQALYELKKLDLKFMYPQLKEVHMFHGTPSENVGSINRQNLNYRYYGKGVGCKFGNGISFAPFSYYSSHYCSKQSNNKHMYLCRVLQGNSHIGWPGLLLPIEGYDTTVKENGHVLVKFHDDVYYPAYVINFEKNE